LKEAAKFPSYLAGLFIWQELATVAKVRFPSKPVAIAFVKRLTGLGFLACAAATAVAQPARHKNTSIVGKAARLRPGQYVWAPTVASSGPLSMVVDLSAQSATLYRNGVAIAASTVSTGRKGRKTPTGAFTVLQKKIVHRSRTYDNASMPYMQRLTWKGIAMHAGRVPGYPTSHGCIRMPKGFAKRLYGVTKVGMPVMIRA
jgi:hypothetical protein